MFGWGTAVKEVGEGVGTALTSAGSFAQDVRAALTGDLRVDDKAAIIQKSYDLEQLVVNGVNAVNAVEAQSSIPFVAGWRPALGWVCVAAFIYHFLACSIINGLYVMIVAANGRSDLLASIPHLLPPIDTSYLFTLAAGMVGLSTNRTMEKMKGVARENARERK